ncbi:MAG TPA: DUF1285 domain-containing protein [Spirochaetota bacterium]|nr:DUF1285 domain-containing protein [Spirochaetota bacterium]
MGRRNYEEDIPPEIPEYIRELMETGQMVDRIVLNREGKWFHNDVEFTNKRIIDFFNKSITLSKEGLFVLHYSGFTYPIEVEDVPFFVTGVRFEGFGPFEKIIMNLSNGETEVLDPSVLYYRDNNALYCSVMKGKFEAKFMRSPSFHVLERLEETDGEFFLSLCGQRIKLEKKD